MNTKTSEIKVTVIYLNYYDLYRLLSVGRLSMFGVLLDNKSILRFLQEINKRIALAIVRIS